MFTKAQQKMIENGVRNLEIFGYVGKVTKENILTNHVFSMYFEKELNKCFGEGFDEDIRGLLEIINNNRQVAI
ncbi:hypothetical protein [Bacillus sp. NPDC094106]|uniref:hypothetical protein n=1 Tax=Bacillus sp. NPDC094106 TaxID=3363949 RepID=UPI003800ACDB